MIFIDFDGTIVDVWQKYYQTFCLCTNKNDITFEKYKKMKLECVTDKNLFEVFGITPPSDYFFKKRELLESEQILKNDSFLLPKNLLLDFFNENECIILTKRYSEGMFFKQLEWLGIGELIGSSKVLNPVDNISKKDFIEKYYPNGFHTIIGDSLAEWEVGNIHNVNCVIVNTGLRNTNDFIKRKNDTFVDSLEEWIKR